MKDEWGCPVRALSFVKTEGCASFYELGSSFDKASARKIRGTIGRVRRLLLAPQQAWGATCALRCAAKDGVNFVRGHAHLAGRALPGW